MRLFRISRVIFVVAAMMASHPATGETSPVFGPLSVTTLSLEETRNVTARGDYANYYGGLAVTNAYYSYVYSYYARYYAASNSAAEIGWYYNSMQYAYNAYIFSYYAYYYSANGM